MAKAPQLITVENQSKVLSPKELFNLVWAVNYQVVFQYGRSRWVTGGYAPPAHVAFLQPGVKPPVGAWHLILLDTSDQAGALGYHDDENGTAIPYSDVFCATSEQDNVTPSSVASHEALEMLVDPNVANDSQIRKALRADTNNYYIVEVGDPVQGNDYDIGAPEGRTTGTLVADFALPAWWGLEKPEVKNGKSYFSYRGSVGAEWEISPQGYMSIAPVSDPTNWTQIYGEHRSARPAFASRLPRVPHVNI